MSTLETAEIGDSAARSYQSRALPTTRRELVQVGRDLQMVVITTHVYSLHTSTHTHTHARTHARALTHAHTHTHPYTHTHTHTPFIYSSTRTSAFINCNCTTTDLSVSAGQDHATTLSNSHGFVTARIMPRHKITAKVS